MDCVENDILNESTSPLPPGAGDALKALSSELDALRPEEVLLVNADVPYVATRALSVSSRMRTLAPLVRERLPLEPTAPIVQLDVYALAAWYAHVVHYRATNRAGVKELVASAKPKRAELLLCAELLARTGHLDPEHVAAIRRGAGYLDLAADLVALADLLQAAWPRVAGRLPLEPNDLKQASALGTQLLSALGGSEEMKAFRQLTADRRARAFTLLVRAYDACRRVATYLRWSERDADILVPSLFSHRRPRSRLRTPSDPSATSE